MADNINIRIQSLIGNLVIVNTNKEETAHEVAEQVCKTLEKIRASYSDDSESKPNSSSHHNYNGKASNIESMHGVPFYSDSGITSRKKHKINISFNKQDVEKMISKDIEKVLNPSVKKISDDILTLFVGKMQKGPLTD